MSDFAARATHIANSLYGPRPCGSGWKARIWDAAFAGALIGVEELPDLATFLGGPDDMQRARGAAVQALMARLTQCPLEKRDKLRARIAAIRSRTLDNAPEVQSALIIIGEKS